MDPLDLHTMIENAKADAASAGALKKAPLKDSIDSQVDASYSEEKTSVAHITRLLAEIDEMVQADEKDEILQKQAALERGRLMKIAKLLAAIDVFSEVSR